MATEQSRFDLTDYKIGFCIVSVTLSLTLESKVQPLKSTHTQDSR